MHASALVALTQRGWSNVTTYCIANHDRDSNWRLAAFRSIVSNPSVN